MLGEEGLILEQEAQKAAEVQAADSPVVAEPPKDNDGPSSSSDSSDESESHEPDLGVLEVFKTGRTECTTEMQFHEITNFPVIKKLADKIGDYRLWLVDQPGIGGVIAG